MLSKRIDFFDLNEFPKAEKTHQGFLRADIFATRTGVFKYLMPDGTIRRELRHPDEVFHEDSIPTLAMVPLTLQHPVEMVDVFNAKNLSVGNTGENVTIEQDKYLKVKATVMDADAIHAITSRSMQEVSCGYTAEVVNEKGVYDGEEYDAVQKNIRYNHVAIVDMGRAGEEVRFKLDHNDAVLYNKKRIIKIDSHNQGDKMEKVTINGQEVEVSKEAKPLIEKMITDSADSEKKVVELEVEKDKLEAKNDALIDQNAGLEKQVVEANEKFDNLDIDKLVNEKSELISEAKTILGDEEKLDGLSNKEIKVKVIGKINPELKLDEKSDVYIEARYDAVIENKALYTDSLTKEVIETTETKEDNNNTNITAKPWEKPLSISSNN